MSRIPKFESKLKGPRARDDLPELPNIKKNIRPILRRSKSYDNLSHAATKSVASVVSSMRKPLANFSNIKNTSNAVSQLKFGKTQTEDTVPELPKINKRPAKINIRRSKSFSDIRVNRNFPATLNSVKPNIFPKVGVKAPPKTATSTNRTNITKPVIKPNVASKSGVKRQGENCESGIKNKVAKKTKVPDWDYKTRFILLQEKYCSLQEDYKIAEKCVEDAKSGFQSKISELEESEKSLRDQVNKLTAVNEEISKFKEDLISKYESKSTELEKLKEETSVIQQKYDHFYQETQKLTKERDHLLNEVLNGEKLRRKLHNCIQDLKGNIRVFCRLRPALNELERINQCNFNFANGNWMEISKPRGSIAPGGNLKSNETQEFTFDKVFNQDATQEEIFEELSQLVQSAMDGYHVCVFAYGQTGSGKTYTMQGESDPMERLGMIPRSVQLIFEKKEQMAKMGWSFTIQASFLEIYNENIRDLLNMKGGKSLDIRYNEGKGTTVSNLTVIPISSAEELLTYMYKSQQNRSTAVTNFNEHSSRSHSITKIYIEGRYQDSDDVYVGSVSLVDLAGSESAKSVSTERLAETKNINKSLSSLGNVMMALYKKETHIPYRNSKLTFLLQSSLGGNCKCLMIVNISPIADSFNESISALRFAAKVKEVKIASNKNKLVTPIK